MAGRALLMVGSVAATSLHRLTAGAAARLIRTGGISSEELVRACLARIDEREPVVRAWAFLDPDLAIAAARACDATPPRGPLHGVPIGIKDVLDTADMPTVMGSPIYEGHRPPSDAASVALARAAGAVILGKTVTAEFAYVAPGPTTNPHDPLHTPGGSSSGSAAAVADFMVPLALGTQTGGSVIRPASYCGVVGYKPTFGAINRTGLKFAAESLDTIGILARSVDDVDLLDSALTGRTVTDASVSPPRIGLCRTHLWDQAAPASQHAVESVASRLAEAGAELVDLALPASFDDLSAARDTINNVERARACAYEWASHRAALSPSLAGCIAAGQAVAAADYIEALRYAERCRVAFDAIAAEFDILLTPAVDDEAPLGLSWTGSSLFQGLWTQLHVPAITLPTNRGPNGLPVGVQLIAPRYRDAQLLQRARWAAEHTAIRAT